MHKRKVRPFEILNCNKNRWHLFLKHFVLYHSVDSPAFQSCPFLWEWRKNIEICMNKEHWEDVKVKEKHLETDRESGTQEDLSAGLEMEHIPFKRKETDWWDKQGSGNPGNITKKLSEDFYAYMKAILCYLDTNTCLLHSQQDIINRAMNQI